MRAINRSILATGAAALAAVALAQVATAATPPTPAASCPTTGAVITVSGRSYVCQRGPAGSGTWAGPLANTASPLQFTDGWAKAADSGMSAAFGIIVNPTDRPMTLIGAASPSAAVVQLHQMAMKDGAMVMQEVAGGLTIPAKGHLVLKPGGNHLMLMGIKRPISPGEFVPVSLLTGDGTRLTVKVLAKTFAAANEQYHSGNM